MPKITIRQAIIDVLQNAGTPLSAQEVFDRIIAANAYDFQAKNPASIVRSQLRRHSVNLDMQKGSAIRCFRMLPDGRFTISESTGANSSS